MVSERKTVLRWLHLSDLHFRAAGDWSQDVVLRTLLDDIRRRYGGAQRPDLLFISGDIAFSGKTDEYLIAENFIKELRETTLVPPEMTFVVPGNHDIDRSVEEDAFIGVRHTLIDQLQVDRFFASDERRRTLFRRQEAYRGFANRVGPPDGAGYTPTSFAHCKTTTVGPLRIRVLLLDSAWLAAGGSADMGMLLVGEPQVMESCRASDAQALTFGLIHHPLSWLREFEQVPIENLLLEGVHVLLRGHVHSVDLRWVGSMERRLTVFTSGAGYENRIANNCYSLCTLDLFTGRAELITHRYVHAAKRWEAAVPQPWQLSNPAQHAVPLKDAITAFTESGSQFVHYGAALVSGYQTEIPRTMGSSIVYANHEVDLPGDDNIAGSLISRLRHLFCWRHVWVTGEWEREIAQAVEQLSAVLGAQAASSSSARGFILQREDLCRQMAASLIPPIHRVATPILEQVRALSDAGDWLRVIEITARWRSEDILTPAEVKDLYRATTLALLQLGRVADAINDLKELLSHDPTEAVDLQLAAACYYEAKEYNLARDYIHRALDAGIEVAAAQRLALAIAGHTGDRQLRQRVTQR